jgi:NAD+ synthase
MDWIDQGLKIDPEEACQHIEEFIRNKCRDLDRRGVILGLSGGFDSALTAYICVRAVGPDRVRLLNMPERDSKPIHRKHAALIAQDLSIDLKVIELSPILEEMGVYDLLPISELPGRTLRRLTVRLARSVKGLGARRSLLEERFRSEPYSLVANAKAYMMTKHRVRMMTLYQRAERGNFMVVGAANRTEYETGTYTQWGCDHCADVMPIIHLYRSQLIHLAQHVGLPKPILGKAADPDILPGLNDKEELLGSFDKVDRVLWGLEHGAETAEMMDLEGEDFVDHIVRLVDLSRPMRESPYVIEIDHA